MDSTSSPSTSFSIAPFSGLVICVTGFSKEARKLIMEATERLGGEYSPNLHPGCTHLLYLTLVNSVGGRKLEHALKYRFKVGLFIVTLQWFIDCVMRNVRIRESLYSVQRVRKTSNDIEESCNTLDFNHAFKSADTTEECFQSSDAVFQGNTGSCLFGQKIYIDPCVSAELQNKVMEAANHMGAIIIDQWFVGCGASYVVSEGSSILRYLWHADSIVTPIWVLKTAKKRCTQRFIRFSADLAREVGMLLENLQDGSTAGQEKLSEKRPQDVSISDMSKADAEQRQKIVHSAKVSLRNRRNHGMQVSLHAISQSTLLDSVCWSISEPPSTATIYSDAVAENIEAQLSGLPDAKDDEKVLDTTFSNLSRPLNESEKNELIFRRHFITILFPVDRFSEMGPSSRSFYSEKGFTCLQILDLIYIFYQEHMSDHEVEAAIHTDSRHADRLRSMYSDMQTPETGHPVYKRIDFMGSRKSFEMLKRISGDNTGNVYELVVRA